jgi:hypothetical protein
MSRMSRKANRCVGVKARQICSDSIRGLVQVAQSQGNTFFDGRRRCSGRK